MSTVCARLVLSYIPSGKCPLFFPLPPTDLFLSCWVRNSCTSQPPSVLLRLSKFPWARSPSFSGNVVHFFHPFAQLFYRFTPTFVGQEDVGVSPFLLLWRPCLKVYPFALSTPLSYFLVVVDLLVDVPHRGVDSFPPSPAFRRPQSGFRPLQPFRFFFSYPPIPKVVLGFFGFGVQALLQCFPRVPGFICCSLPCPSPFSSLTAHASFQSRLDHGTFRCFFGFAPSFILMRGVFFW